MEWFYDHLHTKVRYITFEYPKKLIIKNSRDCSKQTSRPCKDEAERCCLGGNTDCPHNNCQNNLEAKIAEA